MDGIDIYGNSNSLSEAIPGVSLDLTKAEPGTKTTLTVATDEAAIKKKIQGFVSGYNGCRLLCHQPVGHRRQFRRYPRRGFGGQSIKRHLQNMLTSVVGDSGSLQTMSQLGIETQKDGTLQINDATLTKAIETNPGDVAKLLAGENGVKGIATQFKDYLDNITNSVDGFYVGRKNTINDRIKEIDNSINQMNVRLAQKKQNLEKQFNSLETLVSSMNSQSNYLTQQLANMPSLGGGKN